MNELIDSLDMIYKINSSIKSAEEFIELAKLQPENTIPVKLGKLAFLCEQANITYRLRLEEIEAYI